MYRYTVRQYCRKSLSSMVCEVVTSAEVELNAATLTLLNCSRQSKSSVAVTQIFANLKLETATTSKRHTVATYVTAQVPLVMPDPTFETV